MVGYDFYILAFMGGSIPPPTSRGWLRGRRSSLPGLSASTG